MDTTEPGDRRPDPAAAAERLRSWLDDLAPDDDVPDPRLGAWHRAHAPSLIAAAVDLEALAAVTGPVAPPEDEPQSGPGRR